MHVQKVRDPGSTAFKEIWKIYLQSFPVDERRNLWQQKNLLKKSDYALYAIRESKGGPVVGLIGAWNFKNYIFWEHIAVHPQHRNREIGKKMLLQFISKAKKTVITDCEKKAAGKMAQRRLEFYKRLGFKINRLRYVLPPFSPGKKALHLHLLSYGKILSQYQFNRLVECIYHQVYGLAKQPQESN